MANYGSGNNFTGALFRWYRSKQTRLEKGTVEQLKKAGEEGKRLTQEYISTRGTPKSGKRGRIETGKMHDRVGYRLVGQGDSLQIRFGWESSREPYFKYQETGFLHRGGVTVEGMYALSDAADKVIRDLEADIKKVIKSA